VQTVLPVALETASNNQGQTDQVEGTEHHTGRQVAALVQVVRVEHRVLQQTSQRVGRPNVPWELLSDFLSEDDSCEVEEAEHAAPEADSSQHEVQTVEVVVVEDELDGAQVEGIDAVDDDEAPLEPDLGEQEVPEGPT
jgi:hypothetical protein